MTMNKHTFIFPALAMSALALGLAACGDDDDNVFPTVTNRVEVLNHVLRVADSTALEPTMGTLTYTLDRNRGTLEVSLTANIGGTTVTATAPQSSYGNETVGVYTFSGNGLSGTLNFNDNSSNVYAVCNSGGYRVVATLPQIDVIKGTTRGVWNDTLTNTRDNEEAVMHSFTITPGTMTAAVSVMNFFYRPDLRYLINAAGRGATVTATKNGYEITSDYLPTNTTFKSPYNDSIFTSQNYPIQNLKVNLNVVSKRYEGTYKLGSANVTAAGTIN